MVIAKIRKGKEFKPTLLYLLDERKSPEMIGGKVIFETIEGLNWEFSEIAKLRESTEKPVRHFSLAFSPNDGEIDDLTKLYVAERFLELMGNQPSVGDPKTRKGKYGYYCNQYLIVSHGREDPEHPKKHDHDHIHILANAVTFDGCDRIPDHYDYYQAKNACRKIEKEFNLTQVFNESSNQITIPHQHEQRLQRETKQYQNGNRLTQPEPYYKAELQDIINDASADQPHLSVFFNRLKAQGVQPNPYETKTGRQRITYSYKGFHFRGSALKNASFPKLLKKRGLQQDTQDNDQREASQDTEITPSWQQQNQSQSEQADPEKIISLLLNLLEEGANPLTITYPDQEKTIQYQNNQLSFTTNDQTLFQAIVNDNNQWEIQTNELNKLDEDNLDKESREIIEKLKKRQKQAQLKTQSQQQMEM